MWSRGAGSNGVTRCVPEPASIGVFRAMDNSLPAFVRRQFQGATRIWHFRLCQLPRTTATCSPAIGYTAGARRQRLDHGSCDDKLPVSGVVRVP